MCRTTWPPSPRCRPRAGVRSLPTWPLRDLAGPVPGHCGFQWQRPFQGADLLRHSCIDREPRRGDHERPSGHDSDQRLFFQELRRQGADLLGPGCGWQLHELCAPLPDGNQARLHRHACGQGLHHPEFTGKLPGYLSPSAGLKFKDVPNDLAAISKVPAAGWGQNLAYLTFARPRRTSPRALRTSRATSVSRC
jgi:hypothetical protein